MYAYLYLKMNPQHVGSVVVAGNFSFKNLKAGLLMVSRKIDNQKVEDLKITQKTLDDFETQLNIVLTRINNDSFKQTEDIKNCKWCEYKVICKR
jgi:CRISPR/Cas system-associated exonuclease Cas4 (RecB family)